MHRERAARQQTATAEGDEENVERGTGLLTKLQRRRPLSRDDVRIFEGRYDRQSSLAGQALRDLVTVLGLSVDPFDLRAILPRCRDLC